jgi:hypothetical protein
MSLGEMIREIQPDPVLRKYGRVFVGDVMIYWDKVDQVYPKPGNPITIRLLPGKGGSGGKNPLRTILSIAVIAAAAWAGPVIAGAMNLSGASFAIGSAVATAAVSAVGPVNVMGILPPGEKR